MTDKAEALVNKIMNLRLDRVRTDDELVRLASKAAEQDLKIARAEEELNALLCN